MTLPRHPSTLPRLLLLVFALQLLLVAGAAAMRPVAMVVGNGAFETAPLRFAASDAASVADALRDQNIFVREYVDTDLARLRGALQALERDIDPDGIAILYFNGYALRHQGRNYLLPRDAAGATVEAVLGKALPLDEILAMLKGSRARSSIVLLDCLRPSPFYQQFSGLEPGLAEVEPPPGVLIGYTGQPGSHFLGQGPSLFAEHLTRQLLNRKQPITEVLRRMRQHVRQLTSGAQVPWVVHGLQEEVFLSPQGDAGYFGAPIDPQWKPAEPIPNPPAASPETVETQPKEPVEPPFTLRETGALWEKAFRISPGSLDLKEGGKNYAQPSVQSRRLADVPPGRVVVEGYLRTREGVFWLTREAAAAYLAGREPVWLLLSGMSADESAIFAHLEKSPPLESGPPPFATLVPGSAGFAYSPFAGSGGVVDVRGFNPGDEVKCPYSGRLFRVP